MTISNENKQHLSSLDTADFGGLPPPVLKENPSLTAFMRHLEDAQPSIIDDVSEDSIPPARYLLGPEIGSGAVGQIILATDRHLGRKVAIKILHGMHGVSKDKIARFIAEAQITAQLEHPAVVPIHEIGLMPGGMPYFSMKLIKGETLGDIINCLRINDPQAMSFYTLREKLRMFMRLCNGVAYAHSKGVIHRDLKPDNILIGQYGEVQIMDWGLASIYADLPTPSEAVTAVKENVTSLTSKEIIGTPSYMSPEQARGDINLVCPSSDVFSLGLILAELLTLFRVYRSDNYYQTLEEAKNGGFITTTSLCPDLVIDSKLNDIIKTATHPDLKHRYSNAGEMSQALISYFEEYTRPINIVEPLYDNSYHISKPFFWFILSLLFSFSILLCILLFK